MKGQILLYGYKTWWRLGASYRRAFESLGWSVEVFDVEEQEEYLDFWLRSRVGRWVTRRSLVLRRLGSRRWNRSLVNRARELKPDLVLLIGGQLVMPETVESLSETANRVAAFFPDDPLPGAREARPEQLGIARRVDTTFIWSRRIAAALEKSEAGPAIYLPFAWDPEVFPRHEEPEDEGAEVIFVGGWDRRRERLLEPVAETFDLEIWGPDYWGSRTRSDGEVRKAWQGRTLVGEEAARKVARAGVALNLLREQNLPDGTNMRTFEVPGCGGFAVADRTSGATEILPEGEAGAYFDSKTEMLAVIDRHLEDRKARNRMTERAGDIVASEHRYVDRAAEVLSKAGVE